MEKLRSYLARRKITVADFAKKIGSSEIFLRQCLAGSKRFGPEKALRVEEETKGAVTLYDVYGYPKHRKIRLPQNTS